MENEIKIEDVMIPNQMDREWIAFLDRLRKSVYPTADAVFLEYDIATNCYLLVPMEKGRDMWHIYIPVAVVYEILYEN